MIRFVSIFCLGASVLTTVLCGAESVALWPKAGAKPARQHGDKTFAYQVTAQALELNFKDVNQSDDYVHIDLGAVDLTDYLGGGYVEVTLSADQPILRLSALVADPASFWPSRQLLEGGAILRVGEQAYRFYIDGITAKRAVAKRDHLYLFLQDMGGAARGDATVAITKVVLCPPVAEASKEKREWYARQYAWPTEEQLQAPESLYYEDWSRGVEWSQVSGNPRLQWQSLAGEWSKQSFGEKTWDYAFLADTSYANAGFDAAKWPVVSVPEPVVEDQAGGYFWYRREVELPASMLGGKVYLRFDDISEDARIYVNGQLAGTQASVEKRYDWVAENGSRNANRFGVPVKKAITWQHFDRVGIPFPFDAAAVPENALRLVLPIYSGEYHWPLAYEVGDLLKPGKNTLAVRVYGNPMRGWWIFRHRDDRAARNVFGLVGNAWLAAQPQPQIASATRLPAAAVGADGLAIHRFVCALTSGSAGRTVKIRIGEETHALTQEADGTWATEFRLPASFAEYHAALTVSQPDGAVIDSREISFYGTVVEVRDREFFVNGDPYFVRGINAAPGVEWNNDRSTTRREFFRTLRFYQQLGLNTLRIEGAETWQMDAAQAAGFMVMPTTGAASTDWGIGIFGQLVSPDMRMAWDRQSSLALLVRDHANILLWNGGNELHHTPGYDDRAILETYLDGVQVAFKDNDPYRRRVTYANLDELKKNWFFFNGQDVVGWNIYQLPEAFAADLPEIFAKAGDRPVIFTEWGTYKGKPDREGRFDAWENEMRGLWKIISGTPGSAGGFIFAWHGELEDDRGRAFLRELFMPFAIANKDGKVFFKNKSEAPMRDVTFMVVSPEGLDVPLADVAAEIAPGAVYELKLLKIPQPGSSLEICYDTHHGLKHFFTQPIK
ncbi:MAG: hypothetical protein WC205_17485 [Opitutaceae bacterium]|jgi:hypothetical protein